MSPFRMMRICRRLPEPSFPGRSAARRSSRRGALQSRGRYGRWWLVRSRLCGAALRAAPRPGNRLGVQKLARSVERTEGEACLREGFGGAFLAVDHGEDQSDFAAGVAHRVDRLDRRAAGGGDVL